MQLPWPPLRDSDLAGLERNSESCIFRKPKVTVSQQTPALDRISL